MITSCMFATADDKAPRRGTPVTHPQSRRRLTSGPKRDDAATRLFDTAAERGDVAHCLGKSASAPRLASLERELTRCCAIARAAGSL